MAFSQRSADIESLLKNEGVPIGVTVGVNIATPVISFFDNSRTGVSFMTRINIFEDWFFNGEVGYENVSSNISTLNYQSNGTFLKIGGEKNLLSKKKTLTDNIFIGVQYGMALQEQSASSIIVENGYWEDYRGSIPSETVQTHWIEVSGGPRAELLKNLYFGWKIHIMASVALIGQENLKPYAVPGFGNGDKRVNGGFSYTVEYMFPWKKKRK
ncbi:MAG: hypothetical protein GX879_11205 [Bacteroidales bacterium]|nr:hypothetical protein [Bacteroidales bacterium]